MRLMGCVCMCVYVRAGMCACICAHACTCACGRMCMHVSHLCKYNWNWEQRIYIWLENCWTLFHQILSVEMMVLSVWPGQQMMKCGLEETGISKTQASSHEEVTNEDIACHFLRNQGYHSPQYHSTRPDSQPGLLCRMLTRLCGVICRRAWTLAQQFFICDANTPSHWALCQAARKKMLDWNTPTPTQFPFTRFGFQWLFFFLSFFPILKFSLKGWKCQDIEDVQKSVVGTLTLIWRKSSQQCQHGWPSL